MSRPAEYHVSVGERYGHLVVVAPAELGPDRRWKHACRCDCGGTNVVVPRDLVIGRVRSCGCLRVEASRRNIEVNRKPTFTHRLFGHPLYATWAGMIARCTNPNAEKFGRYGGRGITVCDRWRYDFAAFLADMGEKPSPQHSIDRINNDGNYEPGNCRWATYSEQMANRAPRAKATP